MLVNQFRNSSMVYVVDDATDYRFLVQRVFDRFLPQYTLSLFPGGGALLDQLRANLERPALIMLDLHMPGLNGQQTLLQLKNEPTWKAIPVVVITSSSSAEEIQACYEAGANSCLAKPMGAESMRQLLTLICNYWVDTNQPMRA